MSTWKPTVTLKEKCTSCNGLGEYRTYRAGEKDGVPCWSCEGKGWVKSEMRTPNAKWARQWAKEHTR